jgi:hypothetical protein
MTSEYLNNATPEFVNLVRRLPFRFDQNHTRTISPLYYCGAIAGSEFLTYDDKKLYVAHFVNFGSLNVHSPAVGGGRITFYNDNNQISYYGANNVFAWDATAAAFKYILNNYLVENIVFSKVVSGVYDYVRFNGFKITVPA